MAGECTAPAHSSTAPPCRSCPFPATRARTPTARPAPFEQDRVDERVRHDRQVGTVGRRLQVGVVRGDPLVVHPGPLRWRRARRRCRSARRGPGHSRWPAASAAPRPPLVAGPTVPGHAEHRERPVPAPWYGSLAEVGVAAPTGTGRAAWCCAPSRLIPTRSQLVLGDGPDGDDAVDGGCRPRPRPRQKRRWRWPVHPPTP